MHRRPDGLTESRWQGRLEAKASRTALQQKTWTRIRIVLFAVILATLIYSGGNIALYLVDGKENTRIMSAVRTVYYETTENLKNDVTLPEDVDAAQSVDKARFAALYALNTDAVGWLHIPGTDTDFPVVRSADNSYYLERNFEKNRSLHGSIFMDFRNSVSLEDKHIIIYGHNTRDGRMFGQLSQYEDSVYRDNHSFIELNIAGTPTRWVVFSSYVTGDAPLPVSFDKGMDFYEYALALSRVSFYKTGVDITNEDQMLTLSTCNHRQKNARFVVHAKRVE